MFKVNPLFFDVNKKIFEFNINLYFSVSCQGILFS